MADTYDSDEEIYPQKVAAIEGTETATEVGSIPCWKSCYEPFRSILVNVLIFLKEQTGIL